MVDCWHVEGSVFTMMVAAAGVKYRCRIQSTRVGGWQPCVLAADVVVVGRGLAAAGLEK